MTEKIEAKPEAQKPIVLTPQMYMMPVLQDPRRDVDVSSLEQRLAALEETQRLLEDFSLLLKSMRLKNRNNYSN